MFVPRTILTSVVLLLSMCANTRGQTLPATLPTTQSSQTLRELNFLAIADWGMGNGNQRKVAQALADHVTATDTEYQGILTGGDNFYVRLNGVDDPLWLQVFEWMYDPKNLNFPFYITPGNHDYENGKIAIELAYARQYPSSRWKFPSPYYRLDFPEGSAKPLLSLLMLDSCKDQMGERAWEAEMRWLKQQLAAPRDSGTWLIAVGHHPLYSNGDHGDNGVLQRTWGKLFRDHGVDMYVCGHDHDMQHLEIPGIKTSFILVGGGGATTRAMRVDRRGPFSKSAYGFADLNIAPEKLTVRFFTAERKMIHAFERTRAGEVRVLKDGPSDVAIPRTPRSINQPELPATQPATQP